MTKGISSYFRKAQVTCTTCGKQYEVKPSRVSKTKHCSRECLSKHKATLFSGREMSEDWRRKIAAAKTGDKNSLWKGNDVSYKTLHQWVLRHKGKPESCEFCGSTHTMNWANKSHQYLRELDDWLALCKKCHWKYDND